MCPNQRVRILAGHSLKSSFKYTWSIDKRDDPIIPTRGYALDISQELAGIGGDVRFLKQELTTQWNLPIPFIRGAAFGCSLRAGCLWPLFGDEPRLVDRFFLGGPSSLRGFQLNSLGAERTGGAVGGKITGSGALYLTTPLPMADTDAIRAQLFVAAGSLVEHPESVKRFVQQGRVSVGGGLVFRTPLGRLELNLCYPLRKLPTDCTELWQLGLAMKLG